jgi:hypothetical protein
MADGLTLAEYAAAKGLPVHFLRQCGVAEYIRDGICRLRIPYLDVDGTVLATRLRLALSGEHRFRWTSGSRTTLYGWWRLTAAQAAGFVVLVEGESDTQTLWHHGLPALGFPGAATWKPEWDAALIGIDTIYVVIEPDNGGDKVVQWLAKQSWREKVRLVRLDGVKDVSELHLANQDAFDASFQAALDAATPYRDVEATARADEAAAALELARPLLDDPDVLDRVAAAIVKGGYAGDVGPAMVAYLACTSRLLPRPLNLAYVAPSAAGKNHAVNAALALMPPESVYRLSAGTARALVYDEEDFVHRTVVVEEADSIPDDGPAASAVRAIAEDGEMKYGVVERDERTGKHTTRKIVKPGPTGLITTAVRSLREQLGTRHLEVSVPDDAAQTRAVMKAHAKAVDGTTGPGPDVAPFVALQRWLALAGVRDVVVPFAQELMALVPCDEQVRMRRDARQLLTAIQVVALVRQRQRQLDASGNCRATVDDYRVARRWFASVFDAVAAGGVTPPIRETVEAVGLDEVVTRADLVTRLKKSARTISWRVTKAKRGGWLVEDGKPKKLRRGSPLPTETTALPDPELLCGNAATRNGTDVDHAHSRESEHGADLPQTELPSCRDGANAHRARKVWEETINGTAPSRCPKCGGPDWMVMRDPSWGRCGGCGPVRRLLEREPGEDEGNDEEAEWSR